MALPISSLPSRFTKMLLPGARRSSFLAIRSFNASCSTQCRASNKDSNHSQTILRRSANFKPSIWNYDYIQSLSSEYEEEIYAEQSRLLKEEVRMMLCKVENKLDQLELIDVLQRLGVAYHFNNEIMKILDNIYNMGTSKKKNLNATALEFRLLRQHGYDISTDVSVTFQDEMGNFKKCQYADVEGMLSLYEASFHSLEDETILDEARDFASEFLKEYLHKNRDVSVTFQDEMGNFKKCQYADVEGMLSLYEASFHSLEDETILDEARDFASEFLKEYLHKNRGNDLSLLISHALELPFHWRAPRWEAQWFINVYEKRNNMNPALLRFAKLDFNMVQTIHQEELKYTSRWWKRLGIVEKLSFSRDRLVENFFWSLGMNFRPDLGYFRRVITKVNSLITTIDDIYDVYGTMEELELFTETIDRWDLNAMESLPNYMKICFLALNNFVNEVAFETLKENGNHIIPYLRKAWTDLCKSYFIEAKWYHSGYTPSLGEYMENAWISISAPVILVHAYFLVPNSFRKEDLFNLEEYPNLIRFSAMLLRLANDLGTSKRESETGDVPKSVECYMTGASEAEAREHVKSMICTTWKMMNGEVRNSSFSQSFIDIAVNLPRMALCFYQYGDGYTVQDPETKSRILSLIMQPIPVTGSVAVVEK